MNIYNNNPTAANISIYNAVADGSTHLLSTDRRKQEKEPWAIIKTMPMKKVNF